MAITYQVDQLASRVRGLAEGRARPSSSRSTCRPKPFSISSSARSKTMGWPGFPSVHSLAFSDRRELEGAYANTTRANFLNTLDVSCYSFTDVARRSAKLMSNGGSMITLTYLGGERVSSLQRDGGGQGGAGSDIAIWPRTSDRRFRVNDLGGTGQDADSERTALPLHLALERDQRAAAPQYHDHGGRQHRVVPAVGPCTGVTGENGHVDAGYHIQGMMWPTADPRLPSCSTDIRPSGSNGRGQASRDPSTASRQDPWIASADGSASGDAEDHVISRAWRAWAAGMRRRGRRGHPRRA